MTRDLEALNQAGFIRLGASRPQARRYPSRAPAPSQEAETSSVSTPTTLDVEDKQQPAPRKRGTPQPQGLGTESYGHALRLVSILRHKDDMTLTRVTAYATQLPPAAFEAIRERIQSGNGSIRNDAGYAVAELNRMVKEGTYAA